MNRPAELGTRLAALTALLGAAMVTSTYLFGVLSVLSGFMIAEFGITRAQLGIAFTSLSITGAIVAPAMGSLADRGVRLAMVTLFASGSGALLIAGLAPSYFFLIAAAVLGGLALGAGNPATNKIVSERVPQARWGLIIGLKQAGPPLALLAAGIVLPPLAAAFGWRTAVIASMVLPLGGMLASWRLASTAGRAVGFVPEDGGRDDGRWIVVWLTMISVAVAMGISAIIAFLPLFAQEELGFSTALSGALAAAMGLSGVVSRILWGSIAGRFPRLSTLLLTISGVSVASTVSLALAARVGAGLAWVGAMGIGASMLGWHSVAWLVIFNRVSTSGIGKASGMMQLGGSVGLAAGPPAVGMLVDMTHSYAAAWALVGFLFGTTLILTLSIRSRARNIDRREV